jgi:hypothetical protein
MIGLGHGRAVVRVQPRGRTPLFLFVEWEALLYGIGVALKIVATIIAGMIFPSPPPATRR